jgi:hypothetical protein
MGARIKDRTGLQYSRLLVISRAEQPEDRKPSGT